MRAIIVAKRKLTESVYMLALWPNGRYPEPEPGQFIQIKHSDSGYIIPIPISVCFWDDYNVHIVVEARGVGTEWLISQPVGAWLEISEPRGKGFEISAAGNYLIVGGGIGVPPLLHVVDEIYKDSYGGERDMYCILGFASAGKVILDADFTCKSDLIVTTDDGSYNFGRQGRVDDVLREVLADEQSSFDMILACGPRAMLKAVAQIAKEFDIPCQVSMERYMACGVGVCKGCTEWLKSGPACTCVDGPVFDSEEVDWDAEFGN